MPRSPLFSRLRRVLGRDAARPATGASLDRRQFHALVLGALGATATGAAGCGSPADVSVAVIGGGIAGLHCAHRLNLAGVDVTVYEASDRVGGRMWTSRGQFDDDQVFEIGGELIDTNHLTMWALADELGLELDDRWADLTDDDPLEQYEVDGVLVSDEVIVTQYAQVAPAIAAAFDAAEEGSDDEFDALDNTSMRDFLDEHVGRTARPELYAILESAYRGEYGLEIDQQSCLNLVYLIDFETPDPFRIFGDSDERYHTHLGNDAYTDGLAAKIGAGRIALRHALTAVSGSDKKGYTLTFSVPDGEGEVTITADRVVFALPFTKLRQVNLRNTPLSDDKRALIEGLDYGTNTKVMGGFTSAVWRVDYGQTGSLTTDARVQQTWDTSVGQAGESAILTNFLGGKTGLDAGAGTADAWFVSVLPDLERVWPGAQAAYIAGSAQRMHWPTYTWALGSYTCYSPGQWAWWAFEGEREGNLHFCGEHCSLDFQGWMEGAAETGGLVAAEILADLGISLDAAGLRAVGPKMLVPQSTYRHELLDRSRLRPLRRRREIAAKMHDLVRRGP